MVASVGHSFSSLFFSPWGAKKWPSGVSGREGVLSTLKIAMAAIAGRRRESRGSYTTT